MVKCRHFLCLLICWTAIGAGKGLPQTLDSYSPVAKWQRNALAATLVSVVKAIIAQQRSDGALVMGDRPPYRLSPYVANYAAMGLLDAYRITHDPGLLQAVKRWQEWYIAHMNADGTIYDYSGDVGAWRSTNDYDSTDAYAATFMELAWKYLQVAKDPSWEQKLLAVLPKLANSVCLTLQTNGLTMAKPRYPAMYTMDNVEVYKGWVAAAEFAQKMHRPQLARLYRHRARSTLEAINTLLWISDSRGRGHFLVGRQADGVGIEVKQPMVWYPDQMAQLMAIAWLPKTNETRALYFALRKQALYLPSKLMTEDELGRVVWWALAAETVGDKSTVSRILQLLMAAPRTLSTVIDIGLEGHVCDILAHALTSGY